MLEREVGVRGGFREKQISFGNDKQEKREQEQEQRRMVRGFPPLRQEKGAKMGHGILW
jgi:hypothetical protein